MPSEARKRLIRTVGVCPQTVSNLLYGVTRYPRHATVHMLLRALGFTLFARR